LNRTAFITAVAALAVAATGADAQDGKRGEKLFGECAACHSLKPEANGVGPDLHGVFGRVAGSGDFRYSPALKRSGITWTAQTLDAFIADPQAAVPGNRMPFSGLPDAKARADLIQYLQQAFK
jgi:cytochrome c